MWFDNLLLFEILCKFFEIFKGKAVKRFGQYKSIYRSLASHSKFLHSIKNSAPETQKSVATELKSIDRLLGSFFSTLRGLDPHLGQERKRLSWEGLFTKLSWSNHERLLQDLHLNLNDRMSLLQGKLLLLQACPLNRNSAGFSLQDPRGTSYGLSFGQVATWDDLHESLLRLFPENDSANHLILERNYMLHKFDPDRLFLCSSPAIRPFKDIVKDHDKIQISMVSPYHPRHENICPNCGKIRVMESGAGFYTCPNTKCQLKLQFQQSPGDKPDPLTKVALRDILASNKAGICSYLEEIQTQATTPGACSGIDISLILQVLQSWLPAAIPATAPVSHRHGNQRSEIKDFNWVTLYQVHYPDIINCDMHQISEYVLDEVKKHMELQRLCNENRKRILFSGSHLRVERYNRALLEFLKWIIHIINTREPLVVLSAELSCMLKHFQQSQQNIENPYHPLHLRIRCLLWTLLDLMSKEAWILRVCSYIVCQQRTWIESSYGSLLKAIFIPIFMLEEGIETIRDRLSCKVNPPAYMPYLLQYVLSHAGQLMIRQEIYRDLDMFLESENFLDKNISLNRIPFFKEVIKKIITDCDRERARAYYYMVSKRLSSEFWIRQF